MAQPASDSSTASKPPKRSVEPEHRLLVELCRMRIRRPHAETYLVSGPAEVRSAIMSTGKACMTARTTVPGSIDQKMMNPDAAC